MQRKFITLLVFCFLAMQQAYSAPKLSYFETQDPPDSNFICQYIYDPSYRFDHCRNGGELLVLNDGSIWSVGYWWQHNVSKWEHDDIINLSYHVDSSYNFVKFENVTRHETGWGNAQSEPDAFNPFCLWIVNMDVKSLIMLNNGLTFKVNSYWADQFNWSPGDLISILTFDDKSNPYALFNHTKQSVIFYAKLQRYPIPYDGVGILVPMTR